MGSGLAGEFLPATTIRTIAKGEKVDDLIRELAQATYESGGLEHAIVSLKNGTRVIVRGGSGGITFGDDVRRIILHTHPSTTGPSHFDFEKLDALGQRSSFIYELFGDGLTRFSRLDSSMAVIIAGRTKCCRCGKLIETAAEGIGFPAFVPTGHIFSSYSDSAFHRQCYYEWEDHAGFQRLYDEYSAVWDSRPRGLSFQEIEAWGKAAFRDVFEKDMKVKS